ncbi:MAG: hypothetical protein ACK56I_11595, partial [bacterium]
LHGRHGPLQGAHRLQEHLLPEFSPLAHAAHDFIRRAPPLRLRLPTPALLARPVEAGVQPHVAPDFQRRRGLRPARPLFRPGLRLAPLQQRRALNWTVHFRTRYRLFNPAPPPLRQDDAWPFPSPSQRLPRAPCVGGHLAARGAHGV